MIKLKIESGPTGSGLGYQMSSYMFMKTISRHFGYDFGVGEYELHNLKSTFNINIATSKPDHEYTNVYEFNDIKPIEEILDDDIQDDTLFIGYPTIISGIEPLFYFNDIKKDFTFRQEIVDKCNAFMKQFEGEEVISMHFRRGAFTDIVSGMFLCGDDYYLNALEELPKDAKVLIFTNDKEYIQDNPNFKDDRFILVTDVFNGNNPSSNEWAKEIDKNLDISGDCRYYYKYTIAKLAVDHSVKNNIVFSSQDLVNQLDTNYLLKIRDNLYNHSFDLCLMTMCNYHIMANSLYGAWGAKLSNSKKVIYPMYWMQGHDALQVDENGLPIVKRDLGDYDQTADHAAKLLEPHWYGRKNPDPRSIKILM